MKIVFDTNVLISSLITHSACFELFEHCVKNHTIISSQYIIDEFVERLISKFKFSKTEAIEAKTIVFERIDSVVPVKIKKNNLDDKDDIPVVGTALSGDCELLITGDKGLLKIKRYKSVRIISPVEFWKYEK